MRNIALWLHIIGVAIWLGANVAQGYLGPRLGTDRDAALPWFRAVESMSGPIYGGSGALVLLTGIYLVITNEAFGFGSTFVTIGFTVIIISGAMGPLVFGRKTRTIVGHLEADEGDQAQRVYRTLGPWGILDTLLIVVAIFAMVAQWGI